MGRSNVGKSSLLNVLVQRRRLARTSRRPGKTQTINYYAVDHCYFVDLPGYGYAAVPIAVRQQWGPMIERYLSGREQLFAAVQLVDSQHLEHNQVQLIQLGGMNLMYISSIKEQQSK